MSHGSSLNTLHILSPLFLPSSPQPPPTPHSHASLSGCRYGNGEPFVLRPAMKKWERTAVKPHALPYRRGGKSIRLWPVFMTSALPGSRDAWLLTWAKNREEKQRGSKCRGRNAQKEKSRQCSCCRWQRLTDKALLTAVTSPQEEAEATESVGRVTR